MRVVAHHTAAEGVDEFVPVRKDDVIEALVRDGLWASDVERDKFRRFCRLLATIYHYEYFALLERLRHDYYYFGPEIAPHAAMEPGLIERSYADLMQSLDQVLRDANFVELPHQDIVDAHRSRMVLRVEVKAPLDDFRDIRFYRRGRHIEQFEIVEWFGLRRRKIEAEVYDDVVLMVAMKSQAEIASRRQLRALQRRKMRPGSVLLKYFRNVASLRLASIVSQRQGCHEHAR